MTPFYQVNWRTLALNSSRHLQLDSCLRCALRKLGNGKMMIWFGDGSQSTSKNSVNAKTLVLFLSVLFQLSYTAYFTDCSSPCRPCELLPINCLHTGRWILSIKQALSWRFRTPTRQLGRKCVSYSKPSLILGWIAGKPYRHGHLTYGDTWEILIFW